MPSPFKRTVWNKFEVALLMDVYQMVSKGKVVRKDAVFAQQNTAKTANRNSRINFYFVTAFYSLYDICMADKKTPSA